jgi:hypothetical protein
MKRLVDDQTAERSDEMYIQDREAIQELARSAAGAFDDKDQPGGKSQMNKLERVALSASTFGAIADYIKSQMGRDTKIGDAWSGRFGKVLLEKLHEHARSVPDDTEQLLSAMDDSLVARLSGDDGSAGDEGEGKESSVAPPEAVRQTVARRLRLGYAQAFVGHVVAEHSYRISVRS